jgi:chorismate mutase/prephenate dehydratase
MAESRQSTSEATRASKLADITPELEGLRCDIDAIDHQILVKLNERARLVQQVGDLKRSRQAPVYVASRERDLIAKLRADNAGPFPQTAIRPVFREIISATRSLEETVRVAFLGPEGTFSHQAVTEQFGAQVDLVPASSLREVFALTRRGKAHYGVVPVENSTEGSVTECLDALVEFEVAVCGELMLEITHNLLSQSGDLARVRRVASKDQPLAQCRRWLERHLPDVGLTATSSTAAAAQKAAVDPDVAAIGSEIAAEVYGLNTVEKGIEDNHDNTTRFVVIGRESPAPSADDLTSAVFAVRKDQAGALFRLLEPFARHNVNLNSIQSRPMKGKPWEYLFFVDMQGHAEDAAVAEALSEASRVAHSSKILGSYPRADNVAAGGRAGTRA